MGPRFLDLFIILVIVIEIINCQQTVTILSNVQVKYTNYGSYIDFEVQSPLGNGVNVNNAWLGIGFNSARQMGGTDVVMCFNSNAKKSVERFYNQGYTPGILDSTNLQIGLSVTSVSVSNNILTCRFRRNTAVTNNRMFNVQTTQPYLVAAYGTVSSSGSKIQFYVIFEFLIIN
jgi:hypothetical protein